ncbi:MAG: hypothetical protein JW834_04200 [Candidatus Diapherotrites archaeon]|nr:hypothetical protein [Candidatus Diapherotrites archaeon]
MKRIALIALMLVFVGCLEAPEPENMVDCGDDVACFEPLARECAPSKLTQVIDAEQGSLKVAVTVVGGSAAACDFKIKPLELVLPEDAPDNVKALAPMVSMTDMVCTLPASADLSSLSEEDLEKCSGSLADIMKILMASEE